MANTDNPRTGAEFEQLVQAFFAKQGLSLVTNLGIPVGMGAAKKVHKFDLGSENPPVLIECKCHVWTEGGNAPSAKLTVWNEAMLYFAGLALEALASLPNTIWTPAECHSVRPFFSYFSPAGRCSVSRLGKTKSRDAYVLLRSRLDSEVGSSRLRNSRRYFSSLRS